MPTTCYCAAAALSLTLLAPVSTTPQDGDKKVFVTVLGSDGAPVEGLTNDHFAVRESGKDCQVLKTEPLRVPMHVAVLVDTSSVDGVPDETLRSSVVDFVGRLAAFNQVALYSFGDRAAAVVSFTNDAARLRAAATGIFGWSHQRSLLVDAVDLALRDMERIESPRPVIVAITSENPEASGRTAGGVIKRLIAQSTAFHVVSVGGVSGSGATRMSRDIPTNSQRLGGMIAKGEGDREREQLLRQGTASTGGGRHMLTSVMALRPALNRLAGEFGGGYLVTFARRGSDRVKDLQVGIMVDGVTLRATPAPYSTR